MLFSKINANLSCVLFSLVVTCVKSIKESRLWHTLGLWILLFVYIRTCENITMKLYFFSSSHSCFTEFVVWILKILQNDNLQTHRRKEISTYMNSYIQIHYKCNNNLNFDVSNIQEYTHILSHMCMCYVNYKNVFSIFQTHQRILLIEN